MYLQEFKIHLIGGHVLKAADIVSVGSEETSQAYIPVRNILYISTGDVIRW